MKPIFFVIISVSLLLLPASFAQGAGEQKPEQKALDNSDVIMLAKAGFSADFIIDTIHSGKSNFDTSATGLVALAKEGLNEQVLRVIAGVKTTAGVAVHPPPPSAESYAPGMQGKVRTQVIKPSPAGLAMATQTPYYQSTSLLFGLLHKTVGVSVAPSGDQVVIPQLGTTSNSSRMMASFPALVAPAGSAVRYVVIP